MKSIQHVLWRGALALSLVAVGIGSGLGMPAAASTASPLICAPAAGDRFAGAPVDQPPVAGTRLIVLHRSPTAG